MQFPLTEGDELLVEVVPGFDLIGIKVPAPTGTNPGSPETMLDQRRVAAQPDDGRERLFTERYEGLLAWAMGLTNQQREVAEDLVQDCFVQFMLGRTRLEEIENIDGYLR